MLQIPIYETGVRDVFKFVNCLISYGGKTNNRFYTVRNKEINGKNESIHKTMYVIYTICNIVNDKPYGT